ncbi:MAG TPA: toll/interleukin-1 receptor domain-containing protein [Pyrinomonadaceae bacterium]|nr:toll/interleukin-1 receptor domain-containing protein [Pyrinomonadaceae bacterium]
MRHFRTQEYPNGWTKSRLYEVVLTHRDFGISDYEYEIEIESEKINEQNRKKNCAWFIDDDCRLIVADLQLEDRNAKLVITDQGFEFVIDQSQTRRPIKVFISYAREDQISAKRMFADLKTAGFEPWLDDEYLLPGQMWEEGIEEAISGSNFFIALLSLYSVGKDTYVRTEIQRALDIRARIIETKKETRKETGKETRSASFLIPARLNKCNPSDAHEDLARLQWINLFPDWKRGLGRIIEVLKT